jgi:hypothetical protein
MKTVSVSPVSAYYMDKKYLDENGKRKSRAQVRADLAALRPVKVEKVNAEKQPKYTDISGRRVRTEREVKERKVKVKAERVMVSRSGIPTATIDFSTGGTAMTIREYVNGSISVEETFPTYTSDSYTPTQACVLSIVCPGLEYLNISGSNITQIKFNEAELQSLNDLEMYDLSLTTPITIPSLNTLEYLEFRNSSLASVTFGYLPQLYDVNIYDITSLKKLDFSTVGTPYNLYYFEVRDMHNLTELILNNLRFDDGNCEIYDNPSLSLLSIANVSYIYDIDIYDNTIETLLIDGVSNLDNDIDIYDNTIGTLTIKNMGNIDDIDIFDNTVQRIYVSNIGNCDSVDIYDNTGLTVVDIRDCNESGFDIRNNSGLTTFTIQNIVNLDNLDIAGADLTSYTLTNIYNMYSLSLGPLDSIMTSVSIGDPTVNQTLQDLYIYENPNLTSLTLLPMPNLRRIQINSNPVLPAVVLPSFPLLENIYIDNNTLLASIQATQVSSTINYAVVSYNPALTNLDISGGTYTYLDIHGNSALNTLDMRNISIYNEITVYSNALTTVYTGTQTIYGRYYIYNEPFLTTLNLATVTFVNAGQELNISDSPFLANVTMPTTLVNGLVFYMNNCNINQTAANVIEEYFYYSNSQALNNCFWNILNQSFGTLSTAAPPGWATLVTTRGWTIV